MSKLYKQKINNKVFFVLYHRNKKIYIKLLKMIEMLENINEFVVIRKAFQDKTRILGKMFFEDKENEKMFLHILEYKQNAKSFTIQNVLDDFIVEIENYEEVLNYISKIYEKFN